MRLLIVLAIIFVSGGAEAFSQVLNGEVVSDQGVSVPAFPVVISKITSDFKPPNPDGGASVSPNQGMIIFTDGEGKYKIQNLEDGEYLVEPMLGFKTYIRFIVEDDQVKAEVGEISKPSDTQVSDDLQLENMVVPHDWSADRRE